MPNKCKGIYSHMRAVHLYDSSSEVGGGVVIRNRNTKICHSFFKDVQCLGYTFKTSKYLLVRKWDRIRKVYFKSKKYADIINRLKEISPDLILINGSDTNSIQHLLKKELPNIYVITFFHNCEYEYHKMFLPAYDIIRRYFVYKEEHLSVTYSDEIWGLTERDSQCVNKLYGKPFDLVLPTSFEDIADNAWQTVPNEELTLLFVGTYFLPNINGLIWFAKYIMPYVQARLFIVGAGMEELNALIGGNDRIHIRGRVDNLEEWYKKADIVVSPIFEGSGMKTKTAEALMYGKPILGTNEAFVGYERMDIEKAGVLCNNAEEFIQWINHFSKKENRATLQQYSTYARTAFLEHYSFDATKQIVGKHFENSVFPC
ncbi:glycosyltransferase involved in cell wall biosynthesis [Parabacteroides sp. PFB2-10]|uniref:glycosyltransferase n=1 Tax=Parabacteroides sp. PFB2-10 TaxID=1742405 RepID=UPI00247624E5|nr:glycosyltransferase [Parabacteroides sp. PFB2-10]MDH6312744.1 glycosyltransferase involved in cell wall biosynthesis [Parabacteroides sp. PFB2-10]MDL2245623.1 glycosyltransferase family 4 protein [Parabacteroides sp. OttesenSCG-928-J18]